jgi:hypothetical protein
MRSLLRRLRYRHLAHADRGATSLAELLIVAALGLVVLTMTATLLETMVKGSVATTSLVEAEIKTRKSLEDSMRYLRNSVPVSRCLQWQTTLTSSDDKMLASTMPKCMRFEASESPIYAATATSFTVFAYPDSNDAAAQAPDLMTYSLSGGTLAVSRQSANTADSVVKAYCRARQELGPTTVLSASSDCPGATGQVWAATASQVYVVETGSASAFTFLDNSGNSVSPTASNINTIRTVLVDVGATYNDYNRTQQTLQFHAVVSLRGSRFADEMNKAFRR